MSDTVVNILNLPEHENLEFKAAGKQYDFDKLVKYCAALSNEGGGYFVLGVSDKQPRTIVGSEAFRSLVKVRADLIERLKIRIVTEEEFYDKKRVVKFRIPSRPVGVPIQYNGSYWMRRGEELTPMTNDMLRAIFDEIVPDYTAEICQNATMDDLDTNAINVFRNLWYKKTKNNNIEKLSDIQLLEDSELLVDGSITYAALILLGTKKSLGKLLPQAEVIFEFKMQDIAGAADVRLEFREGFLLYYDKIWETINLRNSLQHYQDGLFVYDIPYFNEKVIREILLNAVAHRDYRMVGSIFIRQFPHTINVSSPGGFISGITPENILWKQAPRNRRIAETFSKCGLVERSGQGMNIIYENCIKESKQTPNFIGSDKNEVLITLDGQIQDKNFLIYLERLGEEKLKSFSSDDFYVLDCISREKPIPERINVRVKYLLDAGAIERFGRGRGSKLILSKSFYSFIGKKGVYTRHKGLDRNTNKELILKHIKDNDKTGSPLSELKQVIPQYTQSQIQHLLRELRLENKIFLKGYSSTAKWYYKKI